MSGFDFKATFKSSIDNEAIMRLVKEKGGPKVKEAAEKVCQAAQDNAPVDTGALQESGHVVEKEKDVVYQIVFDAKSEGSTESYARWVEEGTSKMDAQPYLRPAILAAKGKG